MTRIAVRRGCCIIIPLMAIDACLTGMSECEWKNSMIESSWFPPGVCSMACLANLRKPGCCMFWVCGRDIILLMARIAVRRGCCIIIPFMAIDTCLTGMSESEWKNSMIESSWLPSGVYSMACLAHLRKSGCCMFRIYSCSIILLVA